MSITSVPPEDKNNPPRTAANVIDLDAIPGVVMVPLAEGDEKVIEWAYEALKDSPKTITDVLRHLTTISAALLAGTVAFLKEMHHAPRAFLCISLLLSLICALVGLMPVSGPKNPSDPNEGRVNRAWAIWWRTWCAWASIGLLIFGGLMATIGLLIPVR
jgi:hypothetical protein